MAVSAVCNGIIPFCVAAITACCGVFSLSVRAYSACCGAVPFSVCVCVACSCTASFCMRAWRCCLRAASFGVSVCAACDIIFIVVEYLTADAGSGELSHFVCNRTVNKLFFLFAVRLLCNILINAVKTEFYPFGKERQIILYRIYPPFVLRRFIGSKAHIQIIHLSHFPFHCQDIRRTALHKRHRLLRRISLFLSFCF